MLFDKNGFYMPGDNYSQDYDFAINIINGNFDNLNKKGKYDQFKIYDLNEGFKKGNLFPKLYDEYKSYIPETPKVKNEREKALLEIQTLEFAITDLNLYLDLNPNDVYAFELFKDYVKKSKKMKETFTRVYGPLSLDDLTEDYEWYTGVWPWEEGRM